MTSVSVCLSVGLWVLHISKTTCLNFTKFSVHVTWLRLWRSDHKVIPTSGFVDDIMFSCDRQIQIQAWSLRHSELFTVNRQAVLLNCAPGAKFAVVDFLVGI